MNLENKRLLPALAVISALLTCGEISTGFKVLGIEILPGIYFGVVLAIGVYRTSRSAFDSLVVLGFTILGWILAVKTGETVNNYVTGRELQPTNIPYDMVISGVGGGFVGSLITVVGVSLVCKNFRSLRNWALTISIGSIAGVLVEFQAGAYSSLFPSEFYAQLPLFMIWQPAVAYSIASGLVSKSECSPAPTR